MRGKIQTLIAVLVFVFVSSTVPVYAHEGDTTDTVEMTTLELTTSAETAVLAEQSDQGTIADRITQYKARKTEQLADTEERRIMTRCKAAQSLIAGVHERTRTAIANRQTAYQTVQEKLDEIIHKLQAAHVDTTALETAREDISIEVENLRISFTAYETLLSDLSLMECEADPAAFKAALDIAREEVVSIRDRANSLKNMVTTELKAHLQTARTQLSGTQDSAGETGDGNSVSESSQEE